MTAIRIDFAPPSLWRALVRGRRLTWLAGVIGAMLCTGALWSAIDVQQQQDSLSLATQQLRANHAAKFRTLPTARGPAIAPSRAEAVNEIVGRLNVPWHDVFDAMEAATPDSIAMLELAPDAQRKVVRITAEAKNSDDMLAYLALVGSQPFFDPAVLLRHEIVEQDPYKPMRFQFEAHWNESHP